MGVWGSRLPATIASVATAAPSSNSVAAENPRCNSRSDGIAWLQNLPRHRRLVEQNFERGKVGVPFDQRRLRAEAVDGHVVELPHRRRNPRPVVVDQTRTRRIESSQMNFGDGVARNRRDEIERI